MMAHLWGYGTGGLVALPVVTFPVRGIASMVKYLPGDRKPSRD